MLAPLALDAAVQLAAAAVVAEECIQVWEQPILTRHEQDGRALRVQGTGQGNPGAPPRHPPPVSRCGIEQDSVAPAKAGARSGTSGQE